MKDSRSPVASVAVVGLGKLGTPLAATLASKGFRVIGVDLSSDFVSKLNQRIAPVEEPGLQAMLKDSTGELRATTDYQEAIPNSEISCIVVPTPSGEDGAFSLEFVEAAARQIGEVLRVSNRYHVVSLVSTVMPGDTERVKQVLELSSGKICGEDFGLCYSPEFIALGRVIGDLLNPDMILIGESDKHAGDVYESMLMALVDNQPPVMRMNFVNAELTKLAINTYITTKISYANMLARICEKVDGADADVVTQALGLDSRIGPKYLRGAVAYGGPCFPRDNIAFLRAAERAGSEAPLAEVTHRFNREQTKGLTDTIGEYVRADSTIAILGLSYKQDTPVVDESPSLALIQALVKTGYDIVAYDPVAMENARRALNLDITYSSSWQEAIQACDLVVIMTPWEEFRSISPADLLRRDEKLIIIDAWRILDTSQFGEVAKLIHLGLGQPADTIDEGLVA